MNGCVFKRLLPSGRIVWGYSIDAGKDEHGKRKQIFKSGFDRKGDADTALRRLLNEKDGGELTKPDPSTFSEFMKEWFIEHAQRNCTRKTIERYHQLADYVLPHIASTKLQDLSALTLERVLNRVKDAGGRNRRTKAPRPLSAKTVRHIAGLLHVALDTAIRWKLLKTNPVDGVQLPKVVKREARSLDLQQLGAFVAAARAAGIYEFVILASATGCRRGELLALTWADVDFNARLVKISKSVEQTRAGLRVKATKTEKPRELPLPAIAIEILRNHRGAQTENRRLFGPDYRDDLNLVFATPEGDYLKPDTLTAKVCLLASKAGMKGISLHSLRHTYGSHLLSEGVPLPAVSKLLGHSSVYTTAGIYAHSLSKDEIAAAAVWDGIAKKAKIS
ncbi:MAG TPA: tyrosine-type recombinase/integrase [Bryobacteraceae bacterium]|jgi:integrase|nr:tyrosine-type recombinase/integrase [Bryobacteraceae bacterium]